MIGWHCTIDKSTLVVPVLFPYFMFIIFTPQPSGLEQEGYCCHGSDGR